MPTLKQCRYHFKKIARARYALANALNDAHNANVIEYKDQVDSPCDSLWECWERVGRTTEKAMANALKGDVIKELKGRY